MVELPLAFCSASGAHHLWYWPITSWATLHSPHLAIVRLTPSQGEDGDIS